MPDRKSAKNRLREQLRQRRNCLNPSEQLRAAESAARHFTQLPGWLSASRIALYLANDGEIDTMPLSALCRTAGKQLYLPAVHEKTVMTFAEWLEGSELVANRFGIPQPQPGTPRYLVSELDIIVVPLVAWDRQGGRLGMGGGFYDRALAGVQGTLLVGLAHALQEVPAVPADAWDIALDCVVTENGLHRCRKNS